MRRLLKFLMYPWEKHRKRKEKLKKLLKNLGLKLVKHKNTSIILGCFDFVKRKKGHYDIVDSNGGVVEKNVKAHDLGKKIALQEEKAKKAKKLLNYTFNNKVTKISKKARKLLNNKLDDALRKWKNPVNRPGVVAILEGKINGKIVTITGYTSKGLTKAQIRARRHPLVDEWLEFLAPSKLRKRPTHGKCAEPINISEWIFEVEKALNMKKGSMKIEQARKIFSEVASKAISIQNGNAHQFINGLDKVACRSCNPLLKYFNIAEIF